ncbi:hypothetical protein QLX08_005912 [Tetragonisca angustula]|uniref:PiggyBac transposable element-derived protein domain-containing protein n=1 Tax=Tetragonisca angustula TaxID=166442 RepID=A0AAW0ZW87_9HYME
MASTSRNKLLKEYETIELLEHDSEYSDFSDSDSSDNEIDDEAVVDAIQQGEDDEEESVADLPTVVPGQPVIEHFIWENMENYNGVREIFAENYGPRNGIMNILNIVDIFLLFFTEDFVKIIVEEANTYA